jgi:FAD/FMN-containing dehydrogenase
MTRNGIQEHAHLSNTYQSEVVHSPSEDDEEFGGMLENPRSNRWGRPSWIIGALAFLALAVALATFNQQASQSSSGGESLAALDAEHSLGLLGMSSTDSRRVRILKALNDLQAKLDGDIYFPDDSYFDQAAKVWCVGVQPPMAVIEAAHEFDVQLAVPVLANLSKIFDFPFRIRSGGHHKAGYSTVEEGAILSLVRLNHVKPLHSHNTNTGSAVATIGPAVTTAIFLDRVMISHGYGGVVGFCSSVAEGGFALGGGLGLQSRMYGLGADNIESMRIVLADGSVQHVSENTATADLFWALRGAGGGNFGVVTEMNYRVHLASDDIYMTALALRPSIAASVMYKLGVLESASQIPGNLIVMVDNFAVDEPGLIGMSLMWSGRDDAEVAAGEPYVRDLVKSLLDGYGNSSSTPPSPLNVTSATVSWTGQTFAPSSNTSTGDATANSKISNSTNSMTTGAAWGNHVWAAQTWTGFLYPENNTADNWQEIMQQIAAGVDDCDFDCDGSYLWPDIELWGGAIHDKKWHETAFPHREAVWNVGVLLMIPDDLPHAEEVYREQAAKVNAWWPKVSKYLTGSYVNYPMITLGEDEYPRVFWGDNLPRLVKIKQRYDPNNVFDFPMSVPTTRL